MLNQSPNEWNRLDLTRKLNAPGTCLRYHSTTQLDLVIISIACIFYLLPHGCVYRHPSIDEALLSVQELTSSLIGDSSPALRLKKCPDRPTPLSTEGSPCQAPARTIPRPSPGAGRFHFIKYIQLLHVTSLELFSPVTADTATLLKLSRNVHSRVGA